MLVVEAGGNEPTIAQVPAMFLASQKTSVDWQYSTEPEERACLANRGKCNIARGKVRYSSFLMFITVQVRGAIKKYHD